MYVFCSFSVALRNISVHVSKNIWKKVGILVFEVTLSHSVCHIWRPWKSSVHLEITWKNPGIWVWAKGKNPGICHRIEHLGFLIGLHIISTDTITWFCLVRNSEKANPIYTCMKLAIVYIFFVLKLIIKLVNQLPLKRVYLFFVSYKQKLGWAHFCCNLLVHSQFTRTFAKCF